MLKCNAMQVRAPNGMFAKLPADPLNIADKSFLIELGEGQVGLMMISSKKKRPFLFQAKGASGEFSERLTFWTSLQSLLKSNLCTRSASESRGIAKASLSLPTYVESFPHLWCGIYSLWFYSAPSQPSAHTKIFLDESSMCCTKLVRDCWFILLVWALGWIGWNLLWQAIDPLVSKLHLACNVADHGFEATKFEGSSCSQSVQSCEVTPLCLEKHCQFINYLPYICLNSPVWHQYWKRLELPSRKTPS